MSSELPLNSTNPKKQCARLVIIRDDVTTLQNNTTHDFSLYSVHTTERSSENIESILLMVHTRLRLLKPLVQVFRVV